MLNLIFLIILGTVLTEAIVEIVSKAGIFLFLREWLYKKKFYFLYDLVSCPFCFSVWIGILIAVLLGINIPIIQLGIFGKFISYFLGGLFLHKLSNTFHDLRDRLYYSYNKPLDNEEEKADDKKKVIGI